MDLNILTVTLARAGSKGVPHKNYALVAGKPLIQWTIDEVKKSKKSLIGDYVISSDSDEISRISNDNGITFIQRPTHLSQDDSTSADSLIHALQWAEEFFKKKYDIVTEIMCTNPLKTYHDINGTIQNLIHNFDRSHSSISVTQVWDHHPQRLKRINFAGRLIDVETEVPESRRQDLTPPAYIRNGSIYSMKTEFLLKKRQRYESYESLAYVMPNERSVNIDTKYDLIYAQAMLIDRV